MEVLVVGNTAYVDDDFCAKDTKGIEWPERIVLADRQSLTNELQPP